MANKKIEIEIDVNSQQVGTATDKINGLNTATQNLETTTKDFGKGVKIVYDSTGKAIDVVTDSSARLNRQSSALVNAMANLTAEGKQNSAEFTLLQRRHLELASTIEKTKGASRDLFGTFSLLPGAVGQFSQELQVGVELTKVFGNLTLTGLKTQFNELKDLIGGVFANLGGFAKAKEVIEKKYAKPITSAGNVGATGGDTISTTTNTGAETANTTATLANAAAQVQSSDSKIADSVATQTDTLATDKNTLSNIV